MMILSPEEALLWERSQEFRIQQKKEEIFGLCRLLKTHAEDADNIKVLEIGRCYGGCTALFAGLFNEIISVDIDLHPGVESIPGNITLITGSSEDPYVQSQMIANGPYDMVFIDGNHTLEGVTADWNFVSQRIPMKEKSLIAFHDICPFEEHHLQGSYVDVLWEEIKKTTNAVAITFIEPDGLKWGGIGALSYGG